MNSSNYPKDITIEKVKAYTKSTDAFLCPLSANHYNI